MRQAVPAELHVVPLPQFGHVKVLPQPSGQLPQTFPSEAHVDGAQLQLPPTQA